MFQVPEDRETFTKRVWERPTRTSGDGEQGFGDFVHLPATAQFALKTPALLPHVRKIDGIRPFGFLTIRYLDPAALLERAETFERRPFVSAKEPAWLALAEEDGAKTWAHVIKAYAEHRDRKYEVGTDGHIVRRNVLVRKPSLVGLGKEGTQLTARLKLGKAGSADPSVFIDWKRRLLVMGRAEARRLGLPWNRVGGWKWTVRRTGALRGDALRRLKWALIGGASRPGSRG